MAFLRTKTYYIQEALEDKIGDLEMIYLAQKRTEDIRAGHSKTSSLKEVIAENGLSDQVWESSQESNNSGSFENLLSNII